MIAKGLAYAQGLVRQWRSRFYETFPLVMAIQIQILIDDLPVVSHNFRATQFCRISSFQSFADKKLVELWLRIYMFLLLEKQSEFPLLFLMKSLPICSKNHLSIQWFNHHRCFEYEYNSKKFPAGELDLENFKAGNDIMLFPKTFRTESFDKICFRKR